MTRELLLLVAACTSPPRAPRIEHHAQPAPDETFVLDAPLFFGDAPDTTLWTLEHHGDSASLEIAAGALARGTFEERAQRIRFDLASDTGPVTLDCHRDAKDVHASGAAPVPRGEHPVCSTPRTWQPADHVHVAVLVCTVRRDEMVTVVTMAAPPGLQAVIDDCCDDRDNCERRWELRRR